MMVIIDRCRKTPSDLHKRSLRDVLCRWAQPVPAELLADYLRTAAYAPDRPETVAAIQAGSRRMLIRASTSMRSSPTR
jgi:hypothetical protein